MAMVMANQNSIVPSPRELLDKLNLFTDQIQNFIDGVRSTYLVFGNLPDEYTLQIWVTAQNLRLKTRELLTSYEAGGGLPDTLVTKQIDVVNQKLSHLEMLLRLDPSDAGPPAPNPPQMEVSNIGVLTLEDLAEDVDITADDEFLLKHREDVEILLNHRDAVDLASLTNQNPVYVDGGLNLDVKPLTEFEQENILRILQSKGFNPEFNHLGITGDGIEVSVEAVEAFLKTVF